MVLLLFVDPVLILRYWGLSWNKAKVPCILTIETYDGEKKETSAHKDRQLTSSHSLAFFTSDR